MSKERLGNFNKIALDLAAQWTKQLLVYSCCKLLSHNLHVEGLLLLASLYGDLEHCKLEAGADAKATFHGAQLEAREVWFELALSNMLVD